MPNSKASQAAQGMRLKVEPRDDWASFDPHLQEVLLADAAQQAANPPMVRSDGLLDVVVRLADRDGSVPKQLVGASRLDAIVTGSLSVRDIQEIVAARESFNVKSLKAATELYANLHHSVPDIQCDDASLQQQFPKYPGLDGSGVIVGIVDTGCDFAHPNFLLPPRRTRLLCLWDQNAGKDPTRTDTPPEDFDYGREFDAEAIDRALQEKDPYAALGYRPEAAAHGTHVMDIAAGNGRAPKAPANPALPSVGTVAPGVAPGARIIFVNLKSDTPDSLGNSRHLLDAVNYIFKKAAALQAPAVANLSISTSGGPHDGSTLVEMGFEELLEVERRAIVISAGNAFNQDGHVQGTVGQDRPYTLKWHTDPIASRNEMEIWYDGNRQMEVTLVSPQGQRIGPLAPRHTVDLQDQDGNRQGRVSHREGDPNNGANQIDIRVPFAAKPWTIELATEEEEGEVDFHAWIEQGDRGRGFLTHASSSHTLGAISCSESTITVGAYDTYENAALAPLFPGTAAGPTRTNGEKPDVSAPGVRITAARALGGTIQMSGTSMAAPHVTGLIALLFELADRTGLEHLTAKEIRALLRKAARRNPPNQAGWNDRYGCGRIDGAEALRAVLAPAPALVDIPPELARISVNTDVRIPPENLNGIASLLGRASQTLSLKAVTNGHGTVPPETIKAVAALLENASKALEDITGSEK
jgi:subtilisin family serine protease